MVSPATSKKRIPAKRNKPIYFFRDVEKGSSSAELEPADLDRKKKKIETCVTSVIKRIQELPEIQRRETVRRPSIWKVYPHLREQDAKSYVPRIVSIGPLHHGRRDLRYMDEVKLEYFNRILRELDDSTDYSFLESLFDNVLDYISDVREEYSEKIRISDEELAEMLVIDGYFVIGCLMLEAFPSTLKSIVSLSQLKWDRKHLRRDLLLLENQIPFFILEKLCATTKLRIPESNIAGCFDVPNLALIFLGIELPIGNYPSFRCNPRHILHLQHMFQKPDIVPDTPHRRSYWQLAINPVGLFSLISVSLLRLLSLLLFRDCSGLFGTSKKLQAPRRIPGATELHQAGIKFRKKSAPDQHKKIGQLNVSFRAGTLEIPSFLVSDSTCSKLRNFIAFEQCCREFSSYFTDYCVFMDFLINTADDVAILQRYGILESMLGSDAEVAEMFNGLCKRVIWDHKTNYLADVYKEVVSFSQVPHHKWRANLAQNYFRNPWTIFSVMAGVILVVFTVTQTFVTIYPKK